MTGHIRPGRREAGLCFCTDPASREADPGRGCTGLPGPSARPGLRSRAGRVSACMCVTEPGRDAARGRGREGSAQHTHLAAEQRALLPGAFLKSESLSCQRVRLPVPVAQGSLVSVTVTPAQHLTAAVLAS